MNGSARNISLTSLDDLFSTQEGRENATLERIVEIPLEQLYTFKNHPFRVVDDEEMQKTADSIREYGVLMPGIVRPRAEGGDMRLFPAIGENAAVRSRGGRRCL